jgi:hypothetical protein
MANANFTQEDVYNLGVAAGSFSLGDIDQGIHIVLPTYDDKKKYNVVFTPLFENYFDKIPNEFGHKVLTAMKKVLGDMDLEVSSCFGLVYMGAIQAFCRDNDININSTCWIELFEAVVKA